MQENSNPHHATGGEGGNHPKQTHLRTTPHHREGGSNPPRHRKGTIGGGGGGGTAETGSYIVCGIALC